MTLESDIPKYVQLKGFLKCEIEEGKLKPGDKIYSENELAKRFNVSRHTVRQALGDLEKDGWLCRVQGSGTYVNRDAVNSKVKSKLIGVITTYLDDYIFPSIIRGIDRILSNKGYSMILSHTNNKIEKEALCLTSMLEKNVDGFIIEPTKSALPNPNVAIYEQLQTKGIPFVFINGFYSEVKSSFIVEDDERGGYMAANHLFDLGHKRLGGIFKIDDIQGHGRYRGFVRAHREKGLEMDENSIIWFTTEDIENILDQPEYKVVLKRLENCTGIVCYNDQMTLKLFDVLKKEGLSVPNDVSVVSFDDSELATASEIKMTTIAHPGSLLGEKAAYGLLDILDFNKQNIKKVMEPKLIIRGSTKKIE